MLKGSCELALKKFEGTKLLAYVDKSIDMKKGSWDKGYAGVQDLTRVLLCEYANAIEILSDRLITAEDVVDKLRENLGVLRYGQFKKGEDDHIVYGLKKDGTPCPVTDKEYILNARVKGGFGAHAPEFVKYLGLETGICLFDQDQTMEFNGRDVKLSGIDFSKLDDIRHTIFHEFTHVMEKCLVPKEYLNEADIVNSSHKGIKYINFGESADLELEKYFKRIEAVLMSDEPVRFNGISTIELAPEKSKKRIMHNQISEGVTELIAQRVMGQVSPGYICPERYFYQVKMMNKVFTSRGFSKTLAELFSSSNVLISELEGKECGRDLLLIGMDKSVNTIASVKRDIGMALKDAEGVPPDLFDRMQTFFNNSWLEQLQNETKDLSNSSHDNTTSKILRIIRKYNPEYSLMDEAKLQGKFDYIYGVAQRVKEEYPLYKEQTKDEVKE